MAVVCIVVEGTAKAPQVAPDRYSEVIFTLHLRRLPLYYVINLIIPCCLLSLTTIITFLLPSDVAQRSTIGVYYIVHGIMPDMQ